MIHDARIVPIDGRPHAPAAIRSWLGDSRGRWERNTLVVETTNFSPKTNFRGAGENLRLTERFTRIDRDTIEYRFTVDDPGTWARPWTVTFPLVKSEGAIYEHACHEANYGLENILKNARATERRAGEVKRIAAAALLLAAAVASGDGQCAAAREEHAREPRLHNVLYDGRFTFARIKYTTAPAGIGTRACRRGRTGIRFRKTTCCGS